MDEKKIIRNVEDIRKRHRIRRRAYQIMRTDEKEDEQWITVKGTHILVGEGGDVLGGPEALKGKNVSEFGDSDSKAISDEQKTAFYDAVSKKDPAKLIESVKGMPDGTVINYKMLGGQYELAVQNGGLHDLFSGKANPKAYTEKNAKGLLSAAENFEISGKTLSETKKKETKPAKKPEKKVESGNQQSAQTMQTKQTAEQKASTKKTNPEDDWLEPVAYSSPKKTVSQKAENAENKPRQSKQETKAGGTQKGNYVAGKDITASCKTSFWGNADDMYKVSCQQGYDKKPSVVSKDDFEKAVSDGGIYLCRGVRGKKAVDSLKYADTYNSGDGNGKRAFGEGIYFFGTGLPKPGENISKDDRDYVDYCTSDFGTNKIRAALSPKAKIKLLDDTDNVTLAKQGYDAVISRNPSGESVVVVFNRTALIICE